MKLKIVIPVNTSQFNEQISNSVDKLRSDIVTIDLEPIESGTPFIQSRADLTVNAPFVLEKIVQAEKDGYDGIFVTDMDMCGVEAARELVKIPVIGGFRPSFFTAMALGQSVSILTVSDVVKLQNEHIRAFGVTENLASILPLEKSVEELKSPSPEATAKIFEELFELGCVAIERDGADCIMFGCTGFTDFAASLSARLSARFDQYIPVMDPNCVAITFLIGLVNNSLSHSGITYPYKPM
ncbi:aspartate/glutamate racemase family protein [Enterovibrio coralii]|uniref:Racemase n=1 Tax=Enterovibrio coralii TaxID=294935 RepID=A0A135ICX8_9GAMM|nr:aspartate/glutamate racemase family protein [Enterovibrio coralii]KXF83238.1 hypothetical protein ATN88_05995 [Enterovibrio coralii]